MKIEVITTGTTVGYEDYHSEIFLDENKIGECHYDKRQRKYIARVNGKKVYRDSLSAVEKAVKSMFEV